MIGIFVLQGRHCLIYCQIRGVRNDKYITLDKVAAPLPHTHLMELCDAGELRIKVNATES